MKNIVPLKQLIIFLSLVIWFRLGVYTASLNLILRKMTKNILLLLICLFGFNQFVYALADKDNLDSIMIALPVSPVSPEAEAGIDKLLESCTTDQYQDLVLLNTAKIHDGAIQRLYDQIELYIEPLFDCFKEIYFGTSVSETQGSGENFESLINLFGENPRPPTYPLHFEIANDIFNLYKDLGDKFNWYVSIEFSVPNMSPANPHQQHATAAIKTISDELHKIKGDAEILISPYANSKFSQINVNNVILGLKNTFSQADHITLIDLQDGMGGTWGYDCELRNPGVPDPSFHNCYINSANANHPAGDTSRYVREILFPVRDDSSNGIKQVRVNVEQFARWRVANSGNKYVCCVPASKDETIPREKLFTNSNHNLKLGASFALRYWYGTHYGRLDGKEWWLAHHDVDIGNLFRNEISKVDRLGILVGSDTSPRLFDPKGGVSRVRMVLILDRALSQSLGSDYAGDITNIPDFSDTTLLPDSIKNSIKRIAKVNITGGCGGDKFCPDNLVTRDQMAAFLVRTYNRITNPDASQCVDDSMYSDISGNQFQIQICQLVQLGITGGCGGGKFCPNDVVSNEQMAAFINRTFKEQTPWLDLPDNTTNKSLYPPLITNIAPSIAVQGVKTTFTVSGHFLDSTNIRFALANCSNIVSLGGTNLEQRFSCTPTQSGYQVGEGIEADTNFVLNSFIVNVAPPPPVVTSVSPTSAWWNTSTIFTVYGSNLTSSTSFWVSYCYSTTNLGGTSTYRKFRCTPKRTGKTGGVVKAKPGGKVLKSFTVSVKPSTSLTNGEPDRAKTAVLLLRKKYGQGYIPTQASGTMFSDVNIIHYAGAYIEDFRRKGISYGCGNGRFCPTSKVSRAELAVLLLRTRYGGSYRPPAATGRVFSDVPKTHWAAAYIEDMKRRGITAGCGGGKYCPSSYTTRAQLNAFMQRAF